MILLCIAAFPLYIWTLCSHVKWIFWVKHSYFRYTFDMIQYNKSFFFPYVYFKINGFLVINIDLFRIKVIEKNMWKSFCKFTHKVSHHFTKHPL